jgi:hypothetical protein
MNNEINRISKPFRKAFKNGLEFELEVKNPYSDKIGWNKVRYVYFERGRKLKIKQIKELTEKIF